MMFMQNDCSPSALAAQTRHANHYLSILRQANQLYLQSGDSHRMGIHRDEYTALCMLGNAYSESGQSQEALAYFQQEVELARMLQSPTKEIRALNYLADMYESLKDTQRSIEYHEKILKVSLTSIDPHDKGSAHREYALMLARAGNFDAAIQRAEAAQQVFEKMQDYSCIETSKMMIGYFHERKIVAMKDNIPTVVEGDL